MTKKTQNEVRMAEAVYDVLDKYKEVWSKSKGFSKEVAESRSLMQQLEESRVQALNKSKGATETKADMRARVTAMCFSLAGRASVYAGKQKNIEALAKLYTPKTKFGRMAANALLDKLKNVHETLLTLPSDELEMYDVTKVQIEDFKKLITEYRTLIPKPRVVQIAIKNYNQKSVEMMKLIKVSFENMDKLLSNLKDQNFINEYTSARMIIELGSRSEKKDEMENNTEDKKG